MLVLRRFDPGGVAGLPGAANEPNSLPDPDWNDEMPFDRQPGKLEDRSRPYGRVQSTFITADCRNLEDRRQIHNDMCRIHRQAFAEAVAVSDFPLPVHNAPAASAWGG